jgi:hypothetical protein
MSNLVTYDRKAKSYSVTAAGEHVSFPAGVDGKAEAVKCAVRLLNRDVHDACQQLERVYPHLENRIWKAAEIAVTGRVSAHGVLASDGVGVYPIGREASGYVTCSCFDFAEFHAPFLVLDGRIQAACIHLLAYWLVYDKETLT